MALLSLLRVADCPDGQIQPTKGVGKRVHAVVVTRKGASVTADELIKFCKQHIASYKAPKSVEFVDSLPKNPAGKILKRELRKKYRQEQDDKRRDVDTLDQSGVISLTDA